MSKFRIFALLCATVLVGAAAWYLTVGAASLPYVLPLLSLSLWGMTTAQFLEARTAGVRGVIALLPTIATGLAAVFTTLAMLSFYIS